MKLKRRTFLKTGGTILACLVAGARLPALSASKRSALLSGREIPGRCPLCSLGCGLIYRSREHGHWLVEGDPDCPVARGSLCPRGASLTGSLDLAEVSRPLYRPPGAESFEEIDWDKAVHLVARRIKDLRNRDLGIFSGGGEKIFNRFDSLGVITGGNLTNEEAYTTSKLFRALGVLGMDTTVRSSHGMAVSGLLDTLGIPGGTHPATQVGHSDVVVLVGCNPGQTAPALCRFLDRVRERSGTVIVLDPRKSETIKKNDLWLQLRPGTDNAVLGAFVNWVLKYADIRKSELVDNSDAAFIVLSEIMGAYEKHASGKYKNREIVDETLSEPYSIFQRMKKHFERYDLEKITGISGVDIDLLRRACTVLARTASPDFSATFILGSGALVSPSGAEAVRMAAVAQALLGNLDKKGGGVVLPAAAGNAQGVCDMGLMAPYLPGYIPIPRYRKDNEGVKNPEAFHALVQAWYPSTRIKEALDYIPHLEEDESPSVSTIIQGVGDEQIRALIAMGTDPLSSLSDSSSIHKVLDRLDLLVVMDSIPNRLCSFWKRPAGRESTIKTEVLFIPTEPPALKNGSMTDHGRRVRSVSPVGNDDREVPRLLEFLSSLGNSIRAKYEAEGGVLEGPVLDLNWPLAMTPENVAAEINGWRWSGGQETPLPADRSWQKDDRCGNQLYRGWMESETWNAGRRDPVDPDAVGLYDRWGWFWPWGVADPFSWAREPGNEKGAYLRWKGQSQKRYSAAEVLPLRPQLPIKFWRLVDKGSPFPEHHEPFHSPLPDFLTGGQSNPGLQLRKEGADKWGYLSRRPEEVLSQYPVIIMLHRTGHIMGTGGVTAWPAAARELGTGRMVEIGEKLALSLGIRSGDNINVLSPYHEAGVQATALVTGRIGTFERDGTLYHVASMTLYGDDEPGANALTPPVFDFSTGGMELKVFMGRIEKAKV
ncbi:MAG: molybdopterin-dependent oxidoreductase [bacterium]|nr:MAG: molybdopterin-dependent oxidoreductase [bacterium]